MSPLCIPWIQLYVHDDDDDDDYDEVDDDGEEFDDNDDAECFSLHP